jgi:hypothetical protein
VRHHDGGRARGSRSREEDRAERIREDPPGDDFEHGAVERGRELPSLRGQEPGPPRGEALAERLGERAPDPGVRPERAPHLRGSMDVDPDGRLRWHVRHGDRDVRLVAGSRGMRSSRPCDEEDEGHGGERGEAERDDADPVLHGDHSFSR